MKVEIESVERNTGYNKVITHKNAKYIFLDDKGIIVFHIGKYDDILVPYVYRYTDKEYEYNLQSFVINPED